MNFTVALKSPMVPHIGYGNDTYGILRTLINEKIDLRLVPSRVFPPVPMWAAVHLVNPISEPPSIFLHHDEVKFLGLSKGEQSLARDSIKVAWTMWERNSFDSTPEYAATMTERLSTYDLVMVYDTVSFEAFKPYADEAGVQIGILQGGYVSDEWKPVPEDPERIWPSADNDVPFRFVMVGGSLRKDPFIAVEALRQVQEVVPNAELHIKAPAQHIHPAMIANNPGVFLHSKPMSQSELRRFYLSHHAYLAPSRGEGKNLPALEAQTTGIPAVYTKTGGHLAWGDSGYGYPVETVPLDDGSVKADLDSLTEQMLACAQNPSEARRRGELASRVIPPMCDWEGVWRQFLSVVRAVTPAVTPDVAVGVSRY